MEAVIGLVGVIIGSIITTISAVLMDKAKHKRDIIERNYQEKINAYEQGFIGLMTYTGCIRQIALVNLKMGTDVGSHEMIDDILKQTQIANEALRAGLTKISLFADDDVRNLYFSVYEKVIFGFKPFEDITPDSIKEMNEKLGFSELEFKIREAIRKLK